MRCLIAQSDARLSEMLSQSLAEMGHVAVCVATAAEARRRLTLTRYDLVVLDHALPARESGRLAYLAITRSCETRVLTLTGCDVVRQNCNAKLPADILRLLQDLAPARAKRPRLPSAPLHRDLAWVG